MAAIRREFSEGTGAPQRKRQMATGAKERIHGILRELSALEGVRALFAELNYDLAREEIKIVEAIPRG